MLEAYQGKFIGPNSFCLFKENEVQELFCVKYIVSRLVKLLI